MLIPPLANHNQAIFCLPQALKKWTSPPRLTKEPANSKMFFMFNDNIYAEFRTAYKHILIPSYVIRVI